MLHLQSMALSTSFAQLNWDPLFEDLGIPLAIMGFTVVFAALVLVRIFIGTLPRIIAFLDHLHPSDAEAKHAAPAVDPDEIPEEIIAVIAASVAATIREPHRIVRTRQLTSEDMNWTLEGRVKQHSSHTTAPRS